MNICAYAVQAIMYILNTLNGLISIMFIGGGLYIVFAPWGIMRSYFFASGLITILIGVVLAATYFLGSMVAIFWRDNTVLKGDVKQGRRMTYIYQIIQSAIVGCEIYGLIAIKYELDQFSNAYSNLKSMRSYSYDYVEYYLASKFNEIYYIISTSCSEAQFNYMWLWLNSHCPASMNQDSCQACKPYLVTTCIVDSDSCLSYNPSTSGDYDIGSLCAYSFCRLKVVQYVSDTVIWPACYFLFGLVLISLLSVLVNTFISSLHPHPEDKVHPVTEVVVAEGGRSPERVRGGGDIEVPPMALLVGSPGKASSVVPFVPLASSSKSDGSPVVAGSPLPVVVSSPYLGPSSSSLSSSPYASSPPAHYQTPRVPQQPLNTRSPDNRSGKPEQKKSTEHRRPSPQHQQQQPQPQPRQGQHSSSSSSSSNNSKSNTNNNNHNNYYSSGNSNGNGNSSNKNQSRSGHSNQNHQSSSSSQSSYSQSNPQRTQRPHNNHTSNRSDSSTHTSSRNNNHGNPSSAVSQPQQSGYESPIPAYYKV